MASWTLAPAIRAAIDSANRVAPNRSKASDGTIGDQAHASRTSDHNPDGDRMVCAVDLTHSPATGWDCVTRTQQAIADPRTKYVIWNRRIWTPSKGWQPYNGSNPHDKHMHLSVTQVGKRDTRAWFGSAPVTVDPLDPGWSEKVTKEEVKQAVREVLDERRISGGAPGGQDSYANADADDIQYEVREGVRRITRKLGA